MKYRCISCDKEFEVKEDVKPRCPSCLKVNDLEPVVVSTRPAAGTSRRPLLIGIGLLALAAVAGTWLYLRAPGSTGGGTATGPSETKQGTLTERLGAAGLPAQDVVEPCAVTDAVRALDKEIGGPGDGADGLIALAKAVERRWRERGLGFNDQREPRDVGPLSAAELAARLTADHAAPWAATSHELACLTLGLARARGLDEARMVQVLGWSNEKAPADRDGKIGRFALAFAPAAGKMVAVSEPWSGRYGHLATVTVLDDDGAAAWFFGHRALARLALRETRAAMLDSDAALALRPGDAGLLTIRGTVFAASGAPTEALAEFEKAVKARPDAETRTNLAELLLLTPRGQEAEAELRQAVEQSPDYARAHGAFGMLHFLRGELDAASAEFDQAERLDRDSPRLALLRAQYLIARGEVDAALAKAEEAVRLSHDSVPTLLALAGIYRGTARFTEMRTVLDRVLAMPRGKAMAAEIKMMFGYEPTATDGGASAASDVATDTEASALPALPGKLELDAPTLGSSRGPGGGSALPRGLGGGDLKLKLGGD